MKPIFLLAVVFFLAVLGPFTLQGAPTVGAITISPATPSNFDNVAVKATVQPSAGTTLSQVQLTYGTGAVVTAPAYRETMNSTPNTVAWTGAGALNPWTVTATRSNADVKQRSTTGNHTVPVVLSNCTTDGTTKIV
ncbi:MAG: hypothetical protein JWO94_143 [Verrucomicrobiaceae bacterium]|nr:hypothetical protein [Verrucomicrobiaceae bacterium]